MAVASHGAYPESDPNGVNVGAASAGMAMPMLRQLAKIPGNTGMSSPFQHGRTPESIAINNTGPDRRGLGGRYCTSCAYQKRESLKRLIRDATPASPAPAWPTRLTAGRDVRRITTPTNRISQAVRNRAAFFVTRCLLRGAAMRTAAAISLASPSQRESC